MIEKFKLALDEAQSALIDARAKVVRARLECNNLPPNLVANAVWVPGAKMHLDNITDNLAEGIQSLASVVVTID